MARSSSELVIRRATELDYAAAVDLQKDLKDKFDYLPDLYFTFFQRNKHISYIIEENGLPISFAILELSPTSEDVTLMAVRTRSSHQGRGLSVNRNRELRAAIHRDYPHIQREIQSMRVTEGNKGYRSTANIVNYLSTAGYRVILRDIASALDLNVPSKPLQRLSYLQAVDVLTSSDIIEDFLLKFCDGYVPADENGRPVRVNKTELRELFQTNRLCVTTARATDESENKASELLEGKNIQTEAVNANCIKINNNSNTSCTCLLPSSSLSSSLAASASSSSLKPSLVHTYDSRSSRKETLIGLSYCHVFPLQGNRRADFYFYGTDIDIMFDHALDQLKQLRNVCDDTTVIYFSMGFPVTMDHATVSTRARAAGLPVEQCIKYMTNSSSVIAIKDFII